MRHSGKVGTAEGQQSAAYEQKRNWSAYLVVTNDEQIEQREGKRGNGVCSSRSSSFERAMEGIKKKYRT